MSFDPNALRPKLREDASPPIPGVTRAAVLVPLVDSNGEWSIVFTRRSEEIARHAGEISFPGGRLDPGEDTRTAALRETEEELGISAQKVDVLGALPEAFTVVSGYHIQPWVGIAPPGPYDPNPREIAEVIEVSMERLTAPGARRTQKFIRAGGMFVNAAWDIDDHVIWGATARILGTFLDLIPDA